MNSKQKKLKNNKKLRVFLLFLSLSLLFWTLIKLSREYVGHASVKLIYTDIPNDKMLQVEPRTTADITLKTLGFNLLKYKISPRKVPISLANVKRKKGSLHYYLSSDIFNEVVTEFSKAEVITVKPDTLYFDLGKSISKKLRVWPNAKIEFQTGFNLSGDLEVDPQEITISGPKAQVDAIEEIKTALLELKNVNESIDRGLEIATDERFSKVTYSASEVRIKGKVEKFTERTLITNFKVINKPSAYKMVTFPKEIELTFQIGLSDFKKIDENDFSVVCDYSISQSNGIDYLIPRIVSKPSMVKEVKVIPGKIQFLLEK